MTPETLTALQQSIAKWERNAVAESVNDVHVGGSSCPLCKLFALENECTGCPVMQRTGQQECEGSPYGDAAVARWDWKHNGGTRDAFRAAARAEVDFLKSLLPESAP